ncbi:MAG: UDP-glucose/GDP-mannose dehydrogenase family protein [Candidatus Omnitrophica bacterium]|nr:UDP-glucose/GDP-mannose dehydrogenase family protein [Candidatus Omnitrophota bacterium]MCM8800284.1 UDP-glucose/GDP-mannose dehydrogenase family protein [Candidatus Omnitrophota bacterium]
MEISIIGAGYVGLVTASCFAELGNRVICVDNDLIKIKKLKKLILPIYEPGLKELVKRNVKRKRLSFSTSIKEAVDNSKIIFIAVGTPAKENGEPDLTGIENVAFQVAKHLKSYRLIVEKSTVPVETGIWIKRTIQLNNIKKVDFDVASNPEFLREGSAIHDFMHPDRIILGVESERAKELLFRLYQPIKAPILITDIKSAELIKHASNSFLATKISFINAIAQICEKTGADIVKVAEGIGLDKRIGKEFLKAGAGYGGACLPKDLDAFINIAEKLGYDFQLLKVVKKINEDQKNFIIKKISNALWILEGKTVGVLGLTFKPNTDDIRNSVSLQIIEELKKERVNIKAYDPKGIPKVRKLFKDIKLYNSPYKVAEDSDCLLVITEWEEFKNLNFNKIKRLMHQPLIVDARNIFDPEKLKTMGFQYIGVGR